MNRIIAAVAVSLSLLLASCSPPTFEAIKTAISLGSASTTNPITPTRLNQMESAARVLFASLNAWRASCVQGVINQDCTQQIRTVQVYTLQIKPYLSQLRAFVKNNDQVNAVVVWNQLTDVIATVRSQASAAGQTIPDVPGA